MADYNQVHENVLGSDALVNNPTFQHDTAYDDLQHGPMNGLPAPQAAPFLGAQLQEHESPCNRPAISCTNISASGTLTCIGPTCYKTFGTNEQLRKHGEKEGHNAYGCICGTTFTRLDALNRHIGSNSRNAAQYSCEYCYAHQGENAFSRRDHLTQHLKVYHRIDTADKLGQHKSRRSKKATVTPGPQATMLLMPPYPCPVLGCPNMGYDGYLRKVDLDEHVAMMHPSTLMYYNTEEHAFNQQYQVPMQPDHQNVGFGSI